jgi:glycosyltransferase involved in cell wall biosynthesis
MIPPGHMDGRSRRTVIARSPDRPRTTRRAATAASLPAAAPISTVVVAVPARNERSLIERCLTSIDVAALDVAGRVVIVVAADSCRDDTAATARLTAGLLRTEVHVIEGSWRAASRARAAAVEAALAVIGGPPSATTWIANTDADCVVAPTWLSRQLAHAARGAHAVAGIVDLDAADTEPSLLARFRASYVLDGDTHAHVHAANLGLRADAYDAVGGWGRHVVVGEDHELVRRLTAAGLSTSYVTDTPIVTSSRTAGRMPAGFASRLAQLADTSAPRPAHRSRLATPTV